MGIRSHIETNDSSSGTRRGWANRPRQKRQSYRLDDFYKVCSFVDGDNILGVLLDKAQDLIKRPVLTDTDLLQRFKLTVNDAYSKGITSLHDAGFDPASLEFYKRYFQA